MAFETGLGGLTHPGPCARASGQEQNRTQEGQKDPRDSHGSPGFRVFKFCEGISRLIPHPAHQRALFHKDLEFSPVLKETLKGLPRALIEGGRTALFDLKEDPFQLRNLASSG